MIFWEVYVHVTQNTVWDMLPQECRPCEIASGAFRRLVQCTCTCTVHLADILLHVEIIGSEIYG